MKQDKKDLANAPLNCPHCKVNLLGEKIPDEMTEHYAGTHFKREIGIYDFDKDRTVKFRCPDCNEEWI